MGPEALRRIERANWVLGALLVAGAAVFFDRGVVLGVAVGALLAGLNFTSIRWLTGRALRASGGRRAALHVLLTAKMALVLVIVYLAIRLLPMSGLAFAIGLSVFLFSVAVESVRHALRPADSSEAPDGRA